MELSFADRNHAFSASSGAVVVHGQERSIETPSITRAAQKLEHELGGAPFAAGAGRPTAQK
jgi:hypothetical protein